jgi:outer membrane immunogenic protein
VDWPGIRSSKARFAPTRLLFRSDCRPAAGHAPFNVTQSKTETGSVWGGGVEYAIGNHWSLKAEGLWADFGKTQFTLCCDIGGKPLPPSTTEHDVKMFRAGVNYRF